MVTVIQKTGSEACTCLWDLHLALGVFTPLLGLYLPLGYAPGSGLCTALCEANTCALPLSLYQQLWGIGVIKHDLEFLSFAAGHFQILWAAETLHTGHHSEQHLGSE